MADVLTDYVCPECRGDVTMDEDGLYWCADDLVPLPFDLDELEAVTPDPVTGRVRGEE